MNFRLTAILLAAGAVVLVGLLVYLFVSPDKAMPDVALDGLAGVKPDEIDTVEIKRTRPAADSLVFTREKNGPWTVRAPRAARVDQGAVNDLVRDLLAAKPTSHPELTDDQKQMGLADPSVEVTLRKGSDRTATLRIGATTLGGSRAVTFVATGSDPDRPFAVSTMGLTTLFKEGAKVEGEAGPHVKALADFRARSLFGGVGQPLTDAKALKFKQGKATLALEKDKTGVWVISEPSGLGIADLGGDPAPNPAGFTGIRPILLFLAGLAATGPADFLEGDSKDNLKNYGLDPNDPAALRIDYTPPAGDVEILYVGKKVETADKTAPTAYYARRLDDSAVVKLTTDRIDLLAKTLAAPDVLRNRDLLPESDRPLVDAIDLTVGGTTTSLRRVARGQQQVWVLPGSGEPAEANRITVEDLLAALAQPRVIVDFPAPPFDPLFAPAEVKGTVTLWPNGLGRDAKADAKPTGTPIVLTFGKKDGDKVTVKKQVGDRTSVGRGDTSLLSLATKTRLDFVDPKVPSFATNAVVKFGYTKGKDAVELLKDETPNAEFPLGKWTWTKPEAVAGKVADAVKVQALLAVAATLSPGRVVTENPSDADLAKYGLDPKAGPRMKVTVTPRAEKDAKDVVFEFGAETEDKGYVYARHGGGTTVYTVPKVVFDRFQTDDLSPKAAEPKK